MKTEKNFKQKISEIASRIAEEMADGEMGSQEEVGKEFKKKLEDIKSSLSTALLSVKSDEDYAYVVLTIKDMIPGLTDEEAKAGLKLASQTFSSSPAVSKDAPGAMYDKMPLPKELESPKNESFARMVKLANLKD